MVMSTSRSIFRLFLILQSFFTSHTIGQFAGTYKNGVALGGWLVAESWMYPLKWQQMGGERCDQNASTCISGEWGLVNKLGQKRANEVFLNHWETWFTQKHADRIKADGLDHVKIPLGFWIIDELVQAPGEMYAQGGWMQLKRGLRQLKSAGLNVLLDMHAMPGVSASNQMFAGNVTSEMHFYEEANYRRALTWIVILTAMSHLDPDFQRVLGILFINEPDSDAGKTPGLGIYYRDAVTTVRVVEYALGIRCNVDLSPSLGRMAASHNVIPGLLAAIPLLSIYAAKADPPLDVSALTQFLQSHCHDAPTTNSSHVPSYALPASSNSPSNTPGTAPSSPANLSITSSANLSVVVLVSHKKLKHPTYNSSPSDTSNYQSLSYTAAQESHLRRRQAQSITNHGRRSLSYSKGAHPKGQRSCLTTVAMPKRWQWKGEAESMAPYVLGPRAYDDHLYFSFGGVANASYESYMDTICTYNGYEIAKNNSEVPYGHGEFSLATNFNNTASQLRDWGDAQKLLYSKESFWTFWTFRMEDPTDEMRTKMADQWSYLRAVERGFLTDRPDNYFNSSICLGREKKAAGS